MRRESDVVTLTAMREILNCPIILPGQDRPGGIMPPTFPSPPRVLAMKILSRPDPIRITARTSDSGRIDRRRQRRLHQCSMKKHIDPVGELCR
jgi:hypothetical protein